MSARAHARTGCQHKTSNSALQRGFDALARCRLLFCEAGCPALWSPSTASCSCALWSWSRWGAGVSLLVAVLNVSVSVMCGLQLDSLFRINHTDPWVGGDAHRTSRTINLQASRATLPRDVLIC